MNRRLREWWYRRRHDPFDWADDRIFALPAVAHVRVVRWRRR